MRTFAIVLIPISLLVIVLAGVFIVPDKTDPAMSDIYARATVSQLARDRDSVLAQLTAQAQVQTRKLATAAAAETASARASATAEAQAVLASRATESAVAAATATVSAQKTAVAEAAATQQAQVFALATAQKLDNLQAQEALELASLKAQAETRQHIDTFTAWFVPGMLATASLLLFGLLFIGLIAFGRTAFALNLEKTRVRETSLGPVYLVEGKPPILMDPGLKALPAPRRAKPVIPSDSFALNTPKGSILVSKNGLGQKDKAALVELLHAAIDIEGQSGARIPGWREIRDLLKTNSPPRTYSASRWNRLIGLLSPRYVDTTRGNSGGAFLTEHPTLQILLTHVRAERIEVSSPIEETPISAG